MIRFQVKFTRKRGVPVVYIVAAENEKAAVTEAAGRASRDGYIVSTDNATADRLD